MSINIEAIKKASTYSKDAIDKVRGELEGKVNTDFLTVVTVGSFARGEASDQSDIDFYVIYDSDNIEKGEVEKIYDDIKKSVKKLDVRMPSDDGAFDALVKRSDFLVNFGGNDDFNNNLTRRMLFLMECKWIFNEYFYESLFEDVVNKYVKEEITQHQLCRFLLNDLIRYYRTMCVDFEFKTDEKGKTWGDRNIKLLFSRKLLYFSGVLTIAETVQHTYITKRNILRKYLLLTPIERIQGICGGRSNKVLEMYDEFISNMSRAEVREMLNKTHRTGGQSEEFRQLKNMGHHFSWELSKLLNSTYDISHPIHHAIKF